MNWSGNIHYVNGDARFPIAEGNKVIVHICNDRGHWGGGFTGALTERWMTPQIAYYNFHILHDADETLELGLVQTVKVEHDIWGVNLIGQKGFLTANRAVPPIRYEAVSKGLGRVARIAQQLEASHAAYWCWLGGGHLG
jgi:hypothetical protein